MFSKNSKKVSLKKRSFSLQKSSQGSSSSVFVQTQTKRTEHKLKRI